MQVPINDFIFFCFLFLVVGFFIGFFWFNYFNTKKILKMKEIIYELSKYKQLYYLKNKHK